MAKDGRSVQAGFDLDEAAAGNWTLEAKFIDGTIRALSAPVRVEAIHGPTISTQLLGRTAFRAGRPSSITLEVSNSGNVDAVGVPLALEGIPVGSTVEAQFKLQQPQGSTSSPSMAETSFDQSEDMLELEDGLAVPLIVPRVPAGRSVQLEFSITAPSLGTSYELRASVGQCLLSGKSGSAGASSARTKALLDVGFDCARDVAGLVGDVIAGAHPLVAQGISCFNAGADIGTEIANDMTVPLLTGIHNYRSPISTRGLFGFAFDTAGCVVPGVSWVKNVLKFAGPVVGTWNAGADCWAAVSSVRLPQQLVGAFDPNELVGPIGIGDAHYISGVQPLGYRVLFENKPDATAPVQRVEVTDQLDTTKLDPATVQFDGFRFGADNYTLPYPVESIDETIDLRPAQNLQVHVLAETSPSGQIHVVFQAMDPDTLEPPSDPLTGFLPPNVHSPEGEGSIDYTVTARNLASGSVLSNMATITFDENLPVDTGAWSNTIDKAAPTATVTASAATTKTADVSWAGSDDASGIGLWKLEVSRDGEPFEIWRTASEPGAKDFEAAVPGNYSFRAIVFDGAGNQGQSAVAGITLKTTYNLTIARSGSGSGHVQSAPAGIDCGSICANAFDHGSSVTLTAVPDPGSTFTGWSGGGCSGMGACTVSLDTDASVTAKFDPAPVEERPKSKPTPTAPIETPRPDNGYNECVSAAIKAFKKTSRVAKKKHGKARSRAMKAALKWRAKALAGCRSRFQHG